MAAALYVSGNRTLERRSRCRSAVSLIELLVVLFIIGIMLSLLLPALSGARSRANEVKCVNNMRQVSMALRQSIQITKKFPLRNRWTVDVLRWIEEVPLYDQMKNNFDPEAEFQRPPILICPFQADFPSRVPAVGYCHFVLVVDRPDDPWLDRRLAKDVVWEMQDRQLLDEYSESPEEPWYVGPEMSYVMRSSMLANERGPHPEGKYMTARGRLIP
jgi:prepilin-type N-terminal cleavage/methylation domain-containing protein